MKKQLTLGDSFTKGVLKNGTSISAGDLIQVKYGPYSTFEKVVWLNGTLSIKNHFMYGTTSIGHLENAATYCHIKKVSQKDIYIYYKKSGESPAWTFNKLAE